MARAHKKIQLIEFKGTTLPVVAVTLRSLQAKDLATTARELFGSDEFFDGDAAILDLDALPPEAAKAAGVDWTAIRQVFDRHGLKVIGVGGDSDDTAALREAAATAGLPTFSAFRRAQRATPAENDITPAAQTALFDDTASGPVNDTAAPAPASPAANESAAAAQATPLPAPAVPTLIIDRPLRSGQQAYARGGDLVVLAAVNAGAEVIADGSIHIYAPLRGRALAGATGDTEARIFTTRFEAELVSIAGIYRTFEGGLPDGLAGHPVQIRLRRDQAGAGDELSIQALRTD